MASRSRLATETCFHFHFQGLRNGNAFPFLTYSTHYVDSQWLTNQTSFNTPSQEEIQCYQPMRFFRRYSNWTLGRALVKRSPSCSTVSIFTNLIFNFLISSLNQIVLYDNVCSVVCIGVVECLLRLKHPCYPHECKHALMCNPQVAQQQDQGTPPSA